MLKAFTSKYLYLLFDEENPINNLDSNFVFTTEGHVLTLPKELLRASGQASNQTCAVPRPQLMKTYHKEGSAALVGYLEDRADNDYARFLAGRPLNDHAILSGQSRSWPGGVCDAPPTDTYVRWLRIVSLADVG